MGGAAAAGLGRGLHDGHGASLPTHTPASGSQIWLTALCLVLVFTVTLSVFPAITAMVTTSSKSPGKWGECWGKAGAEGVREGGGRGSG